MSQRPPENPVARQLHIKFGVVQRTQKELSAYHAELASNRAKVESMRASGADEFDIKKQVRAMQRCVRAMVHACINHNQPPPSSPNKI